MKRDFREKLKERLYLDGGTGSMFVQMGISTAHAEVRNVEDPETVKKIHRAYFEAGSDVVYANTFGCNRKKADLSVYTLEQLIIAGVKNAKEVADEYGGYALYDCGPIGELLYPYGKLRFDDAYAYFAEQAEAVAKTDADGVIIETVSDLQELRAAILAFKEKTHLPVLCSMTFEKSGRTFTGTSAESYVLTAQALGVDAIGLNCGTGAKEMANVLDRMLPLVNVPVFVKPNAGMPRYENGKTVYDVDADGFAEEMEKIAMRGVGILGGCCGTDPEYIKKTVERTKNHSVKAFRGGADAVCSYSGIVCFGEKTPLIIGERVNPTNKPLLKQAILNDDFDYILSMCVSQTEQGADLLDVNLGMAGVDEGEKLVNAVQFVQSVADVPLVIDTAKKSALERAVRVTNGVCIVNSVSGEQAVMDRVFPVVKKYGSYVVALCMDERGIPEDAETRIEIAKRILEEGKKYGIGKEKFLFDPLTMAVSVNVRNGVIVMDTLSRLQSELGVKTTLGLSNISFGLPNREKINGTFLTMLAERKVTSAIVNPALKPCSDGAAKELLCGNDPNCAAYIALNSVAEKREEKAQTRDIRASIIRGLGEETANAVKEKATEENYNRIIDDEIIVGLNDLGKLYEEGKAFLPQLIAGSEAAKLALEYIKRTFMAKGEGRAKATVLLATVKGDVHDIGKNIVKAVTSNYGYRIVDLGKDVSTEEVLAAVEKYEADAVGLSALMTTTIDNMTETVGALKEKYPRLPVIVGGAVVTAGYAETVGAIYSKDARNNVKILENLFPNR